MTAPRTATFLILGTPPSPNRLLGKHWRAVRGRDGAAGEWHDRAAIAVAFARSRGTWDGLPFARATVRYRVWLDSRRRRDLDGIVASMKWCLDALVPAVLPDDSWTVVPALTAEVAGVDRRQPRVEVVVEALSQEQRASARTVGSKGGGP